jgi:hypothetical protein
MRLRSFSKTGQCPANTSIFDCIQQTLIHDGVLDLRTRRRRAGLFEGTWRLYALVPFIQGRFETEPAEVAQQRGHMTIFRLHNVDEGPNRSERLDHRPVSCTRAILVLQRFDQGCGSRTIRTSPSYIGGTPRCAANTFGAAPTQQPVRPSSRARALL